MCTEGPCQKPLNFSAPALQAFAFSDWDWTAAIFPLVFQVQ
jgi:hypothetical protein